MIDFLLIFIGVAYANNLVLALGVDRARGPLRRDQLAMLLFAGLLLAIALLPLAATARLYLAMLALATTAMAIAAATAALPALQPALVRVLRAHLPSASAALAVVACALLNANSAQPVSVALLLAILAATALSTVVLTHPALQERLDVAQIPRTWRGAPMSLLTACVLAMAWTGCVAGLPW